MGIIEIKRTWLSVLLGLKSACGFWYWVSCSLPVMRNFFMWHMTSLYLELTSDYHLAYFSELSPKQIVWTIENKLTSLLPPVIRYLNFKCTWVNPFESELILSLKKKKIPSKLFLRAKVGAWEGQTQVHKTDTTSAGLTAEFYCSRTDSMSVRCNSIRSMCLMCCCGAHMGTEYRCGEHEMKQPHKHARKRKDTAWHLWAVVYYSIRAEYLDLCRNCSFYI